MDNTYLLWDVAAMDSMGSVMLAKIMAFTEEDAIDKTARIVPGRTYKIRAVTEYWMPGVNFENVAKAMEKACQKEDTSCRNASHQ